MRGNTIEIKFLEKRGKMAKTIPLYQYDYGQRLIITDLELPTSYEIHFANEMHGESVLEVGDSTGIDIPDSLLETGKNIYLWLFLHDGLTDGETEYSGVIPVIKRAERSEDEPTPEQQGAITTAIVALNAAVEATGADVTATAADALKAEGYSSGTQNGTPVSSGTYYHNNASYYAGQASTSATNAGNAQTAAETAQGKAEDAQTAAETAQGKAEDAQEAAETAQGKAEDAQEAAEAAQAAAEAAATAAESMIDDSAGAGDTDKVWSADKLVDEFGNTLTKSMLKSTTPSSRTSGTIATTSGRQYAVHPDADGNLSVNVPWTDEKNVMPYVSSVSSSGQSGNIKTLNVVFPGFTYRDGSSFEIVLGSSVSLNSGDSLYISINGSGKALNYIGTNPIEAGVYWVTCKNSQYTMRKTGIDTDVNGITISTAAGKGVSTSMPSSPTDNTVPTAKAVKDYVDGEIPDISGKADKVASATSGNFAALDSNGNLVDSGHKHSDYLTSHQDISGKLDKTDFYATEMPVSSTDSTKVSEKLTDLNGAINANSESISDLQKGKAPVILDTASGAIASFPDGADGLPVEHCVVEIPVDAEGVTGFNVTRCGKNLFVKSKLHYPTGSNARYGAYGCETYSDTTPNGELVLFPGTYTFTLSGANSTNAESISVYDESNTRLKIVYNNKVCSFDIANKGKVSVIVIISSANFSSWDNYDIQLELGDATAYEPYTGSTYPVNWQTEAGTIYDGGSIDLTTGILTVNTDPVQTYQLDPVTINTLLGTNNIYADTGDVEVQYRADTKLFCDKNAPKVSDVQVNGSSVVTNGVANVPVASANKLGVVKINTTGDTGIVLDSNNKLKIDSATNTELRSCYGNRPIIPTVQNRAVFYGLAKAAGDTTQNSITTFDGTYTESAKSAISSMLNAPETVSGSTPSITAKAGVRYICGEVSTLTIVVPSTGIIDVVFDSGSTATVLTVTPPTGVTMSWANGFDPTSLDANTTYEINIMDGKYGVVGKWT